MAGGADQRNQDTPEATAVRLSGELLAETTPNLPPASSRQSGRGEHFAGLGIAVAKNLLRDGLSLEQAARIVGMTKGDLDRALWGSLGHPEADVSGKWSDEDTARLIKLFRMKVPGEEIASCLNRTHAAIRDKINILRKRGLA